MQAQMEIESTDTLNDVATKQRRSLVRDRFVGLILAVGLVVGVLTIDSAAHASLVPQKASVSQPMPFGK